MTARRDTSHRILPLSYFPARRTTALKRRSEDGRQRPSSRHRRRPHLIFEHCTRQAHRMSHRQDMLTPHT